MEDLKNLSRSYLKILIVLCMQEDVQVSAITVLVMVTQKYYMDEGLQDDLMRIVAYAPLNFHLLLISEIDLLNAWRKDYFFIIS